MCLGFMCIEISGLLGLSAATTDGCKLLALDVGVILSFR